MLAWVGLIPGFDTLTICLHLGPSPPHVYWTSVTNTPISALKSFISPGIFQLRYLPLFVHVVSRLKFPSNSYLLPFACCVFVLAAKSSWYKFLHCRFHAATTINHVTATESTDPKQFFKMRMSSWSVEKLFETAWNELNCESIPTVTTDISHHKPVNCEEDNSLQSLDNTFTPQGCTSSVLWCLLTVTLTIN